MKDWLGETRIERDGVGNPVRITDHKGRTVSYEWGDMGERRSITYPDGRKACYFYDDQMRLEKMQMEKGGNRYEYREIGYAYDFMGRISEKQFPEGMRTLWHYDDRGQLAELVHEDERGILDRYLYEYDLMGNRTAVTKERRGLREESGRYEYGYDALSRLVSVSRDGNALRDYAYDTFGNRSGMADHGKGRNTSYSYDALNRLISAEEDSLDAMAQGNSVHTDYSYDNRGNMIREEQGGQLVHGYAYSAMNRLAKAWDDKGREALYRYNGLGQRTGKTVNGREQDYLLDLTKPYHNLLGTSGEGKEQSFYFDWNVAAMEEKREGTAGSGRRAYGGLHYYMQDELGSPLRVSGFMAGEGTQKGRNGCLNYGYDEFGNDLGKELEEAGIPNPYDGQGEEQPFGYTWYRYDGIGGTYFAQAREYQTGNGRFTAEDVIRGNGVVPGTLNRYGYCFNSPLDLVDYNGKDALLALLIIAGETLLLSGCSQQDIELIEPVIEPQPPTPTPGPAPIPTSQYTPVPQPTPTPQPTQISSYTELTEEEKLFVATICGESIGEGEVAWQFVANTIMNRLESKHWTKYSSVTEIITKTGYDAYSRRTDQYCIAMEYLNNRTYDDETYENVINTVMPIYYGECEDMSGGATLYYNPTLVTPKDWNFSLLTELQIKGLDSNKFKAYRYIDDCAG